MHGELLSLMLALEDVLEIGDVPESTAGQPLPIEGYENLHYLLGRRFRNKRKEIAPPVAVSSNTGIATAAAPSGSAGGGKGGTDEPETKPDEAVQSIAEIVPASHSDITCETDTPSIETN